ITETVFLDGSGKVREFVGGYTDWRRQGGCFPSEATGNRPDKQDKSSKTSVDTGKVESQKVADGTKAGTQSEKSKPAKLSYKLKLELEQLPGQIEALEQEVAGLQERISQADFYSGPPDEVSATLEALTEKENRLEQVIERWMELEEQANQ
ncbi:MAG TPA: ABC transporter ATP-binding protein, partial [Marinobacter adhaerens]|nr:ABC transporter ATP-binding protein [Marinobacter adhaerens]